MKSSKSINFAENPDNVDIDDWVYFNGKVGQIKSVAKKTDDFLQFWVHWEGEEDVNSPEMARNLKKVIRPVAINSSQISSHRKSVQYIDLSEIIIDQRLQQRVQLNQKVVNEYVELYRNGTQFPPVTLWHCTEDGKKYLVDGFHRVAAAELFGKTRLPFIEKSGTFREAVIFSVGVNSSHGLRRSNEDKRKAVFTLLTDPEWSQWSDNAIAKKTNTSQPFVSKFRHSLSDLIPSNHNDTLTYNIISSTSNEDNGNLTNNVISSTSKEDNGNLTNNVSSSTSKEDKRKYEKGGKEYEMNVSGIKADKNSSEENKPKRKFLPPDVTAKGRGLKLFAIEIQRDTLEMLKEYMEKEDLISAENAIRRLLTDKKE